MCAHADVIKFNDCDVSLCVCHSIQPKDEFLNGFHNFSKTIFAGFFSAPSIAIEMVISERREKKTNSYDFEWLFMYCVNRHPRRTNSWIDFPLVGYDDCSDLYETRHFIYVNESFPLHFKRTFDDFLYLSKTRIQNRLHLKWFPLSRAQHSRMRWYDNVSLLSIRFVFFCLKRTKQSERKNMREKKGEDCDNKYVSYKINTLVKQSENKFTYPIHIYIRYHWNTVE